MSSYEVTLTSCGTLVKSWTRGVPFEDAAKTQLENVAKLPFIHKWVAAMPDVHAGIGATVGSVIPTTTAIIPAAVGVDIGCGMLAQRTSLTAKDLPDTLESIRALIEKTIPHGRSHNGGPGDCGAWQQPPSFVTAAWQKLAPGYAKLTEKQPSLQHPGVLSQLGTLGSGNHFIEICLDEVDRVWIMLHSGSRGVGGRIGSVYIDLAKKEMSRWMIPLPDQDLAYFPTGTTHFSGYLASVLWAQNYASENRKLMLHMVVNALNSNLKIPAFTTDEEPIECRHNYVAREKHYGQSVWVTRKGAVRANSGELVIIPGSMGAKSYIARGLGNPESFNSCSHGAGRAMSRNMAKKNISLEDHVAATAGVSCRKDESVLDESPAAYKDIDAVMEAQQDLVTPVHTLKQVLCIKG